MRVRASLPSYKQIEVELPPSKTVRDLRKLICKKLDIEPELTKLLFRGKRLSEGTRISKLGESAEVVVDYLWARHLILWGSEGQRRIRSATILLAGAGAIGNEVAKNLAMLGVGRLLIVDRDNVELSNVSRMIFFESSDLGKNKAEVLARNLHRKYPYVETVAFRGELEKMPLKFYLDSELVVCGLDNAVSRIYLTQICRKYSIPMVDGGITGLNARVHVYIPPDDACPICIFPPNQYSQIVGLRNPCDAPLEEGAIPSFATSISLVSSILAQEATKLLLGWKAYREKKKWPENSGQPLRTVLFIDLKNNRFSPMDLKRGEKCFVCGKDGTAKDLAMRMDLPLARKTSRELKNKIRDLIHEEQEPMMLFAETTDGEENMDGKSRSKVRLERGDYIRVFVGCKNGELRESILRLT